MGQLDTSLNQQGNFITHSLNMDLVLLEEAITISHSMAILSMNKDPTASLNPALTPCMDGTPAQTPDTSHSLV